MIQNLIWKLIVIQLNKKFHAYYGTQKFIIMFIKLTTYVWKKKWWFWYAQFWNSLSGFKFFLSMSRYMNSFVFWWKTRVRSRVKWLNGEYTVSCANVLRAVSALILRAAAYQTGPHSPMGTGDGRQVVACYSYQERRTVIINSYHDKKIMIFRTN